MSWSPFEVIWDWPALAAFYRLHPHTAMIVDRAVIQFARTGEGPVAWSAPYHRLRAGFYDVALRIDARAETVTVIQIYRARR